MSRLARKPIATKNAQASLSGGVLSIKGPKGTLTKRVHPLVDLSIGPEGVSVMAKDQSRFARALIGTYASHVKNMIAGVDTPYVKKLIVEGVGYKMEVKGREVILAIGLSHTVSLPIPEDVTVTIEKNVMTLMGPDKESVGQFAADIRRVKPPEPYLGKGIRYEGEVILRKQGKKAV